MAALKRLRDARGDRSLHELENISGISSGRIERILSGHMPLGIHELYRLAATLGVTVGHVLDGADPNEESPSYSWLLRLKVRKLRTWTGATPPDRPFSITVVTEELMVIHWSPWSSRPVTALDVRAWDGLGKGPGFAMAAVEQDGVRFTFKDRFEAKLSFEEIAGLWPDVQPAAPRAWRFDVPPSIDIVSIMLKGEKQRRMDKSGKVTRLRHKKETVAPSIEQEWYSVPDVAKLMGLHAQTVRRYCRDETIACDKVGPRLWRIHRDEVARMLGKGQAEKVEPKKG